MRFVAGSQFAVFDHLLRSDFKIVCLAEERKEVDENGGQVEFEAEFTGVVRPRERVVEVVETFADCAKDSGLVGEEIRIRHMTTAWSIIKKTLAVILTRFSVGEMR